MIQLDIDPIFPIAMPTLDHFFTVADRHIDKIGVSRSTFTGKTRVFDWDAQLFQWDLSLALMKAADAVLWQGFFRQIYGKRGSFFFCDPHRRMPLGVGTGTPRVNGGSQVGDELITDGWTAGQTGILFSGDFFSLEGNLYMVIQDANSDGSGNATFKIWPRLRSSPADNALLTVTEPRGVFRMIEDPAVGIQPIIYEGAKFTIIEEPR